MSNIEDRLWEHLVEHHEADRAQMRATTVSRAPRRPIVVGVAATGLAAVGVAGVLATSSGSGSTAASGPGARGSVLSAPSGPTKFQDTAYIVKRVKAKVAADSQIGTLIHTYSYGSGDVRPNGSIVNLKFEVSNGYEYYAPDGAVYWRTTLYDDDAGSARFDEIDDWIPGASDKDTSTRILINLTKKTYSQNVYDGDSAPGEGPTPNLLSSPSQVQEALQNGQVTQKGMAIINGTQAIALSVALPNGPTTNDINLTLYIDAQTYQPLRTVSINTGGIDLEVNDWMPATPENIAIAKDDSIPAGYTKVAKAY